MLKLLVAIDGSETSLHAVAHVIKLASAAKGEALFTVLVEAGYIPYRVGTQSMSDLDPEGDCFWHTVRTIKQALDPKGILNPGKVI